MLTTIISTVIGLSVLILVHELGHFLAAKAVNIQVPRFSLGFGARLAGFRVGETEFVLSAIPLGGYVKMAGMEDDEAAEALEGTGEDYVVDPARTFDSKSLPARTLVISAGVIMNLLFAFLVFTGLSLAYGETLHPVTRISTPPAAQLKGAGRVLAAVPDGATLAAVGAEPVKTWQDVGGALARAPGGPLELRFSDAPPVTLNLPASQEQRAELLNQVEPFREPVISDVVAGSAASRAGLRRGDRVVRADGRPVGSWLQLVAAIQSHAGKPLALVVERAGKPVALTVTPEEQSDKDALGKPVKVGKIGAAPMPVPSTHRRVGFAESVRTGAEQTWGAVVLIGTVLKDLLTGQLSPRNMGGILSIGEASGQTAQMGLEVWLGFIALFSVNLAVLNLLPIPILDGGHLMFLAFEAVRGRPLSVEARIRLSQVGLVIVVALMIWANGNDVVRLVFGR
ncbi:RIP metalloprotease RseP [Longimicrobium sp.]|uniref:RIP metalloprotease RseP n=1 Tax=Longimicrobium sp. TaxID=2029185 RepID=UPI002C1082DB|nr:RIP metalloprotease RseP [Longimicrobium sp.]HSU13706.1 RIP metalloprotease RseP [Longimicrobium sp.]